MPVSLNQFVKTHHLKSYAGASEYPSILDCSLGTHYESVLPSVIGALRQIDPEVLRQYPQDTSLKSSLVTHFRSAAVLAEDQITLGGGSYDLLASINLMYLLGGKSVFTYVPHFSAYSDHTNLIGARTVSYQLSEGNNYAFDEAEFMAQMSSSNASLVHLENPNNPTGQILPLDTVARIVQLAKKLEMAVIVDEAYGEYMPVENSAATLVGSYEHLYVTRSFSKGWGLAGIRVGYCISSSFAAEHLQKYVTPFNCSSVGRELASAALNDRDFLPHLISDTADKKARILKTVSTTRHIKAASTHANTPIVLLRGPQGVDLWQTLRQAGLITVSGTSFDALNHQCVRLMVADNPNLADRLLLEADCIIEEILGERLPDHATR